MPEHCLIQLVISGFLSSLVLLWHWRVWPMENRRQNLLYMINEYMYLCCCFFALGFSEYNPDPEVRYRVGNSYLGLLAIILLTNVVVMIVEIVVGIVTYCKKRKQKKQVDEENKRKLIEAAKLRVLRIYDNLGSEPADKEKTASRKKNIMSELEVVSEHESSEEEDGSS